jgi:fatty-acyl-CoA synthase
MRPDTLGALLARNVAAREKNPAVTDAAGTLDWSGFEALVRGLAGQLARVGAGPDAPVALWLPNCTDYLALCFACARVGALAVHLNSRFRSAEIGPLLRRSGAAVLVTDFNFSPVNFPAILADVPAEERAGLRAIIGRGAEAGTISGIRKLPLWPDGNAPDVGALDSPCLTFTTSGTTGGPKLVLHDQRGIAGHAFDVMRTIGTNAPDGCLLAATPLCGTFGNAAAMAAVAGGAHVVCLDRFEPSAADALIRRHRVTHMVGGDEMLGRLAEAAGGRPHDSMRFFGYAAFGPGAAASVAAGRAMGLAPHGVYGSSELQALFAAQPPDRLLLPGGDPVSGAARFSVRDPASGEDVAAGEAGELCVDAPSRFRRYLGDDAATARAMTTDGLFRTGDLARTAGRGFVFEARLGDTLRLGGFLVNPEEIEGFLQAQAGIAAAQAVAVTGEGGHAVSVAFVQVAAGSDFDEAALIGLCRVRLARFKVPARIVSLAAFPVADGPNGPKIQRARLREMAQALIEEAPAGVDRIH